jgi:hypothetical protein
MEPTDEPSGEGMGRVRADLRLAMRAIRLKCDIPPVVMQAIVGKATRVLQNPEAKQRDVARASATLLAVQRQGFDAAREEDRISRLDAGTATDRVEVLEGLSDTQLAAVARVLAPKPVEAPCRPTKPKRKR